MPALQVGGRKPVLSLLKRKNSPAADGNADEAASVQAARTRARRRLIGAAVLVGLGIIGFPLLFETQPRPIAVDIPIEIPPRDGVPPLSLPAPKAANVAASAPAEPDAPARGVEAVAAASSPAMAPPAAAASPSPAGQGAERASPATPTPAATPSTSTATATAESERSREAQRALALLEGKPTPAAAGEPNAAAEARPGRFVVQAGAYTDATSLREARQKVERLGLKTYTQVVETGSGARTRVRVGPFASREEADKAASRIKSAGLAVSVLSL